MLAREKEAGAIAPAQKTLRLCAGARGIAATAVFGMGKGFVHPQRARGALAKQ